MAHNDNNGPITRTQECELGARLLIRVLTRLNRKQRKNLLNAIHEEMDTRTLRELASGAPRDCTEYVISLMRVYGRAQFLHAIVAFDQKFKAFRKQRGWNQWIRSQAIFQ